MARSLIGRRGRLAARMIAGTPSLLVRGMCGAGHAAFGGPPARDFAILLEALRMPNEDTISKAPMTISQMATTNVRISIDSRGDPSITMPANRLTKPRTICQPRPGR
jgi:hypothetical protein